MALPLLILACIAYAVFATVSVLKAARVSGKGIGDSQPVIGRLLLAGGVPLFVASVMAYLFLVAGGATTAQLNVGRPAGMDVWSTWVELWPSLLFFSAASGIGNAIWVVVCAFKKAQRDSFFTALFATLLSGLALFTVASYFPSA